MSEPRYSPNQAPDPLSNGSAMIPTPAQAWDLLCEYNQGEFHRKHSRIVGDVLRWFAQELGYGSEADFWEAVGILHDLDFEQWPNQHCIKEQELLRQLGVDERLVHAVASHGYMLTVDIQPAHEMEKVLYAVDELTGLIGAVALMRPSKSVLDLELKSVKKKYKNANFAAGCSRAVIERGADMLGWSLDDVISKTILAMRAAEAGSQSESHESLHEQEVSPWQVSSQSVSARKKEPKNTRCQRSS